MSLVLRYQFTNIANYPQFPTFRSMYGYVTNDSDSNSAPELVKIDSEYIDFDGAVYKPEIVETKGSGFDAFVREEYPRDEGAVFDGEHADSLRFFVNNESRYFYNNYDQDLIDPYDRSFVYGRYGDNLIFGNLGNDVLRGNFFDDWIFGEGGEDEMYGGQGNDVYYIDNEGDRAFEDVNAGIDTIYSSISYKIDRYVNIENLYLTGSAYLAKGNALDNMIRGNEFANRLVGDLGADTMTGGKGDDIYVVENTADRVVEKNGEGIDAIQSTVSQTLAANVEKLYLTGTSHSTGVGNALNNYISGQGGNNILNGRHGNDTIISYSGNDIILFDTAFASNNVDYIKDFLPQYDTVSIHHSLVRGGLTKGALKATAFKDISDGRTDADDRILYQHDSGKLYYDADGSGAGRAALIAIFENHAPITAADILIV